MNFLKKLFSPKKEKSKDIAPPSNNQADRKYELLGVDLTGPTLNALIKRYEAENGKPASDAEKEELKTMASELLRNAFVSEPSNEEKFKYSEEELDYRYHAHLVLSFIRSYHYNFCNLNSFYDYDNAVKEHKEIIDRLNGEEITNLGIKLAIRFCHLQYAKGTCDHLLSVDEENRLINKDWGYPDAERCVKPIIPVFKEYWDDVLRSYKRPSAKIDRLKYLVELLDNVGTKPLIQENKNLQNELLSLKDYYAQQLE